MGFLEKGRAGMHAECFWKNTPVIQGHEGNSSTWSDQKNKQKGDEAPTIDPSYGWN